MPEITFPPNLLFEANVEKIGLLGPEFAKDVAFVYESIRAFRSGYPMLTKPIPCPLPGRSVFYVGQDSVQINTACRSCGILPMTMPERDPSMRAHYLPGPFRSKEGEISQCLPFDSGTQIVENCGEAHCISAVTKAAL